MERSAGPQGQSPPALNMHSRGPSARSVPDSPSHRGLQARQPLRKTGELWSTHPHSEETGRARQHAGKLGQADRCDKAFVYEPATMRCKEMSKKIKEVVQGR